MNDERALGQLDTLIAKGAAVPRRRDGEQWITGGDRLEPQPYHEWRSQSLAFARSILRPAHPYLDQLQTVTEPLNTNNSQDPQVDQREAGLGVLKAIREDVAKGYLTDVRSLIAAEVFSDFLEMAEHPRRTDTHTVVLSRARQVAALPPYHPRRAMQPGFGDAWRATREVDSRLWMRTRSTYRSKRSWTLSCTALGSTQRRCSRAATSPRRGG